MQSQFKEEFYSVADEWKQHCRETSYGFPGKGFLDCDAYRKIISMGPDVLPLIRDIYSGDEDGAFFPITGWAFAVEKIVSGSFKIPENLRGKMEPLRDYTIHWLDSNMEEFNGR